LLEFTHHLQLPVVVVGFGAAKKADRQAEHGQTRARGNNLG
jgi:hypothetical protein